MIHATHDKNVLWVWREDGDGNVKDRAQLDMESEAFARSVANTLSSLNAPEQLLHVGAMIAQSTNEPESRIHRMIGLIADTVRTEFAELEPLDTDDD